MPRRKRRLDQALHDRCELLARSHPMQTVAEIVGINPSQLSGMKKRGWKALSEGAPKRARPTDFEIQSADMTFAQLCAHYGCGNSTMQRWFAETARRRPSWRGDNLRRSLAAVSAEEMSERRRRQWETRRAKYGPSGHRKGADCPSTPESDK